MEFGVRYYFCINQLRFFVSADSNEPTQKLSEQKLYYAPRNGTNALQLTVAAVLKQRQFHVVVQDLTVAANKNHTNTTSVTVRVLVNSTISFPSYIQPIATNNVLRWSTSNSARVAFAIAKGDSTYISQDTLKLYKAQLLLQPTPASGDSTGINPATSRIGKNAQVHGWTIITLIITLMTALLKI